MSNPLIGVTLSKIYLADDAMAIKFVDVDGREIIAACDADCCSNTWIEDLIDVAAAIGSPIINAEDIDLPEHLQGPTKTGNYEEEMQYYGFAIQTAKGTMTIGYRNSSNGYYGGSLTWPGEYNSWFYGGVYGQNNSSQQWVDVSEAQG